LIASDPGLARQLAAINLSGADKKSYPTVARAATIARRTEELASSGDSEEIFGARFDVDPNAVEGDSLPSQGAVLRIHKLLQSQGRPTSRKVAQKMMPEITNAYRIVVRNLKTTKQRTPKSTATIRAETKVSAPQLKSILRSLREKRLIKYGPQGGKVYFAPHR
jgi:hypothetical protein